MVGLLTQSTQPRDHARVPTSVFAREELRRCDGASGPAAQPLSTRKSRHSYAKMERSLEMPNFSTMKNTKVYCILI